MVGLCAAQTCGWSRVDHLVPFSDSGAWDPKVYRGLVGVMTVAQIGGALWEGSQSRLGRTMWQGIDAQATSAVASEVSKLVFRRVRPIDENNPCLWFKDRADKSFPSTESALAAALVTPYVLEHGRDNPAVHALLAVPLYVGVGRVKNQAHWQTDVVAGWAIGGVAGWYAHSREVPIFVALLPNGVAVGLKRKF
jgi:undecaprenyl-diphosphatase